MGPDDICQVTGKVWVLRGGEPVCHYDAAIFTARIRFFATEELRLHDAATDQVFNLATVAIKDNRFSRIFTAFAANLREERAETVVVIHGPAVEGMVMTLGTLNSHPHENLGNVFGDFQCISFVLIIVSGSIGKGTTVGA